MQFDLEITECPHCGFPLEMGTEVKPKHRFRFDELIIPYDMLEKVDSLQCYRCGMSESGVDGPRLTY